MNVFGAHLIGCMLGICTFEAGLEQVFGGVKLSDCGVRLCG